MKRMKEFVNENRCLEKMYTEEQIKAKIAKDIITKNCEASSALRTGLQDYYSMT